MLHYSAAMITKLLMNFIKIFFKDTAMGSLYILTSSTRFTASFSYALTSSLDGTTVTPTPIVTQGKLAIQINENLY